MIHNSPHMRQSAQRHAFTLVEILVSITVLTLLVVLVSQLTNSTASIVTHNRKHMDADSQARLVFNRIALDIGAMVKRSDVDYSSFKSPTETQDGNDHFAFYSEGVGYFTGDPSSFTGNDRSAISLVSYAVLQDPARGGRMVLQRLSKALGWEADSGGGGKWRSMAFLPATLKGQWNDLFTKDPDYTTVGSEVFRMEYTYLLKPDNSDPANPKPARLSTTPWYIGSHSSVDGFRDVAAIVVAIGVLDSNSNVIVDPNNTSLAKALRDAEDGKDIMSSWVSVINDPNFATLANIPKPAASAVRVYQRYFYLNGQ